MNDSLKMASIKVLKVPFYISLFAKHEKLLIEAENVLEHLREGHLSDEVPGI